MVSIVTIFHNLQVWPSTIIQVALMIHGCAMMVEDVLRSIMFVMGIYIANMDQMKSTVSYLIAQMDFGNVPKTNV